MLGMCYDLKTESPLMANVLINCFLALFWEAVKFWKAQLVEIGSWVWVFSGDSLLWSQLLSHSAFSSTVIWTYEPTPNT